MDKYRIFCRLFHKHSKLYIVFISLNILSFSVYILLLFFTQTDHLPSLPPLPYLINTSTCYLKDYPMFDAQTRLLFTSYRDQDFGCSKWSCLPFAIRRVNYTWLEIDFPQAIWFQWSCFAHEIRSSADDRFELGSHKVGPLGRWTNFANNLTTLNIGDNNYVRWDAVKVECNRWIAIQSYTKVVPLIQHYDKQPHTTQIIKPNRVNVLLLGIDSVSRLNFLRHMSQTKGFIENHGFIPLYGYHKVGENSFPNIMPMLTGHRHTFYCNKDNDNCASKNFQADHIPLIFKNFTRQGYLTTFIEDMPKYGFFTYNFGGQVKQLFDYYLRPVNLAIYGDLSLFGYCYQDKLEDEIYWEYVHDQMEAFRNRGNQSFFIMAHVAALTHDMLNYVGYADRPFYRFVQRMFESNLQENTVIMFYSDHAIRFGPSLLTQSHFYEERLPFFYIYIPDSLVLEGRNASELRDIVRANQHRLSSHFDLHATMLHLLSGQVPGSEPYGRTLLEPLPLNRTCHSAGIPPDSCLCNSHQEISLTNEITEYSLAVVRHINQAMTLHRNHCIPLDLSSTERAFRSFNSQLNETYCEVHFTTEPNGGRYKATVRLDEQNQVLSVEHITRTNRYGEQSHCVQNQRDLVQFCLCRDMFHMPSPHTSWWNIFSDSISSLF